MTIPQLPAKAEQEYYQKLSKIESNDNPKAKAKTSSASGRFQFIRSTWEGLGYDWKDVFNDKLQWEAIVKLTRQNANALVKAGCAVNFSTLYGAHFLGVIGLLKVMRGMPDAPISSVTSTAQRRANPTILNGTIRDFTDWLRRKTGDDYTKRYTPNGWVSGPDVVVPPEPDTIVAEPEVQEVRKAEFNGILFVLFLIILIAVAGAIMFANSYGGAAS